MRRLTIALAALTLGPAIGGTAASQQAEVRTLLAQLAGATPPRGQMSADIDLRDESGALVPGVRCATRRPSDVERTVVDAELRAFGAAHGLAHRDQTLTIPVVMHVVTDRMDRFGVPEAGVRAQIEVLDAAFRDHGFRFELREIRRHVDDAFARKCLSLRAERTFKKRQAVDPAHTLNVYTCKPAQGVLGYSWFPSDFPEDHFMHGVVVLYSSLPGGGASPFDEGDTLVHEVGHYLGLYHTFEDGCSGAGDRVADTAAERTEAYGCPVGRDTCPAGGVDPIYNYMDYTDDACMDEFAPGQELRMDDQVAAFRPRLGR